MLGDLTIDYAERRVTLAGRPLPLIAMEYRLLAELSANAGRLLTYEHLLERVWGEKSSGDVRPMRTIVSKLRRNGERPRSAGGVQENGFCTKGYISVISPVQSVVHHPPTGRETVNTLRKGRFRSACTSRTFERYIVYHGRDGASGT